MQLYKPDNLYICPIKRIVMNNMSRILFLMVCSLLTAGGMISHAETVAVHDEADDPRDSTLDVIGWFCKNDTLEYWINESSWKFNGADTIKTSGVSTLVRLVVTDSTASGYQMDYTFLKFESDSIADTPIGNYHNRIVERLSNKIVGTTIKFETDECGAITRFNNLGQIKKQAKGLFKEAKRELDDMPEIKKLKEMGINLMDLVGKVDTDQLVEGYTKELNLLFMWHGKTFNIGKKTSHEDATDTDFENDSQVTVSTDTVAGTYSISADVVSTIPQSLVKSLVGGFVSSLKDDKMSESFQKEFDSQVNVDATSDTYYRIDYMYNGWPCQLVSQSSTMIGNRGKAKQTYIDLHYYSLRNY